MPLLGRYPPLLPWPPACHLHFIQESPWAAFCTDAKIPLLSSEGRIPWKIKPKVQREARKDMFYCYCFSAFALIESLWALELHTGAVAASSSLLLWRTVCCNWVWLSHHGEALCEWFYIPFTGSQKGVGPWHSTGVGCYPGFYLPLIAMRPEVPLPFPSLVWDGDDSILQLFGGLGKRPNGSTWV